MFTGIVEEMGTVKNIARSGGVRVIEINAGMVCEGTRVGDSISVNGACLTVTSVSNGTLSFDAVEETLRASNLGVLKMGERVNLERSLQVGSRVSGHFVTGHVDCVGIIRGKRVRNNNVTLEIAVPAGLMQYVVRKGSIAVDGISLTVMERKPPCFCVAVIPHTYKHTNLLFKGPSHKLNIEFDMLVKRSAF